MHLPLWSLVTNIGWVDVVAILLVLWGLFVGLLKGLESEIPKLLGAGSATIIGFHFCKPLAFLVRSSVPLLGPLADSLALGALVLACWVLVALAGKMVESIVTVKFTGPLSRLGGAAAGVLRMTLTFALVAFFLLMLPFDYFKQSFSGQKSLSGPFFAGTSEKFYRLSTAYLPVRIP